MTSNKTITRYSGFLHGGDYNPEQWLNYPEILKQDIEYTKKAHSNINRSKKDRQKFN